MNHDARLPSAPARDSGIVDLGALAPAAPLVLGDLGAHRPRPTGTPSLATVALALGVLASFASTAMASRALYLARHGGATHAPVRVEPARPDAAARRDEPPAAREAERSVADRGASSSTPGAHAPPEAARPVVAGSPEAATPTAATPTAARATRPQSATTASTRRSATPATPGATAPSAAGSGDSSTASLDALMERVASPSANAEDTSASSAGVRSLPEVPERAAVSRALSALGPRVDACGEDATAMVRFVFDGPTGGVRSATATGDLAGSAVARCVEDAVRGVTLPPFARSPFVVTFPYRL